MTREAPQINTNLGDYSERVFVLPDLETRLEHADPSTCLPLHYHPESLYIHVIAGEATLVMDGKSHVLHAGDQKLIPVERFHSLYFGRQGCSYRLIRRARHHALTRKEDRAHV